MAYQAISDFWRDKNSPQFRALRRERIVVWRREGAVTRLERPTRLDRARRLGYKAKQGYIIVRARIRRGGRRKPWPRAGRRSKKMTIHKTPGKSLQWIAEERAAKRWVNLEVLGSYWVGEDGRHKWFEVILIDPHHPSIKNDKRINWITDPQHRHRVYRGLTSSGKKVRGLRGKGTGSERFRPGARAYRRRLNK